MTQDVPDRLEGGALSQHGGRGRVAKHPGAQSGRANAGPLDRACRGLPNDLPRDGDPRGQNRAEHAGRVERWTGVFAGVQEGIADLLRKREPSLAATFPGDHERPVVPVEVCEAESDNVAPA